MAATKEKDNNLLGSNVASSTALVFMTICLIMYILHVGRAILIPFVVAVFVWYLINAVARWLTKVSILGFKIPRFFCFLMAILALASIFWGLTEIIISNVHQIRDAGPIYQKNFEKIVADIVKYLNLEHEPTIKDLIGYIDIKSSMKLIAKTLTGLAGKTLVVALYVGFLLYEQRFFNKKIIGMFEDKRSENKLRQALANIDSKMQRYMGVKSFVATCDTCITFCLLNYFEVDFAGFLAVFAFFLHFIPYAGSVLAIGIPSTIALIHSGDLNLTIKVAASLGALGAFLGHFLEPYLMGDKLNLSPIFIISSLTMWGMVWGISGMFLAVPILAMIMITLSQFPFTQPFAIMISKTGIINLDDDDDD